MASPSRRVYQTPCPGTDRGLVDDRERIFHLGRGKHRVGRLPRSEVWLPFDGVSRRHAVLRVDDQGLLVEDRESTNGTFVDQRRIKESERVGEGAVLGFASVRLAVTALDPEEARIALELPTAKTRELTELDSDLDEPPTSIDCERLHPFILVDEILKC